MHDSFNPYQAPLSQSEPASQALAESAPYFTTGQAKLVAMSLCTFGLYHIYWFYRNWQRVADRRQVKMRPLARGIFAIFYCHSLFKDISDTAWKLGVSARFDPAMAAVPYIILQFASRLPDPYGGVCFLAFIPMLMANKAACQANDATLPDANTNTRIEGWNWLAVLAGGPLFVVALFGIFLAGHSGS